MKNLRRKIYLFGLSIFSMLVALILFGNRLKVSAAPSSIKVEYKVYSATAYDAYLTELEYWGGWDTDFQKWLQVAAPDLDDANGDGVVNMKDADFYIDSGDITSYFDVIKNEAAANTAWAKASGLGTKIKSAIDPTKTCYVYYGNKNPSDILGADYKGSIPLTPLAEKTEFKPEDTIVIEPWVTVIGDTQNGAYIMFDHTGYADSSVAPVFYDARTSDYPAHKLQGGCCYIGWSYDAANLSGAFAAGTSVCVGGVKLKLKSAADGLTAGSYWVTIADVASANKPNISAYCGSSNTGYTYSGATASLFDETPFEIVIEGSGNATNLKSATINGNSFSATSSPSISAITTGTSTGVEDPTSIKISAAVAGGGTVTDVKFGTSTGSGATTYSAVDNTGSTGTWDLDIHDDTKFIPGSDIYVTIETKSGDGSTTGSYEIIVKKSEKSIATLEGVAVTYTPSGSSTPVAASLDKPFASGTYSYTIIVPTGSDVKVTPTYDVATNNYQKCYVGTKTTSTASGTEETIGTTANSFTIKMESQDKSVTKPYTFTLTRTSDDTSLTKMEYQATGGSKTAISLTGTDTYNVTTGIDYTKSGFTIYPTLKTGQTAKIWEIETPTNKVAITASGKPYTFTVDTSAPYDAITKTLVMEVTSAFGTPKEYTINITRTKADEDVSLSAIEIKYTYNGSPVTAPATKQGDGTYLVTGVPYGVTSYQVKTTLTKTSIQQWIDDGSSSTTKLTSGVYSSTSHNFATQKTQTTKPATITVYAQNLDKTQDYILNVERDGADNDSSLSTLVVNYTKFDSTTGSVSGTASDSINYSADNIPYLANTYTITANLTKPTLQKWAIATSVAALPTTPTSGTNLSGVATSSYTFATSFDAISDEYFIRVFAQDDTSTDYTLKVNRKEANTDVSLTKIEIKYGTTTVQANYVGGEYVVNNVPFKTNDFKIVATLSSTNAAIQQWVVDGGTTKYASAASSSNVSFAAAGSDGGDATSKSVKITVIAQDTRQTKDYNIVVNREEADRNLKLDALSIVDNNSKSVGTFDPITQTFTIDPAITKLAATVTSLTANATLPSGSIVEVYMGTKNSNGTARITTAAKTSLVAAFNSSPSADDTFEFEIYVKNELGATSTPITPSFTRAKMDDTNTITVTAEADIAQAATSLTTLTVNNSGNNYMVNAEYETSYVTFTIKCSDPTATDTEIYINGATTPLASPYEHVYTYPVQKAAVSSQKIEIEVYTAAKPYSAYPKVPSATYAIYVNRDAAEDVKTFKTLELTDISGTVLTKGSDSSSTKYNYKGIDISTGSFSSGKYKLNAEATSAKATIYWSDDVSDLQKYTYDPTDEFDVGLYPTGKSIYISCYSQYGNKTTIEIYTCTKDSRDSDNKVTNIEITEKPDFEFFETTDYYEVEVPFTAKQVTIKVTKNSKKSTLTYTENGVQVGGSNQGLNDQYVTVKTDPITSGSSVMCEFLVTAENESAGTTYKLKITRLAGQTGKSLETLKINGIDVYGGTNANVLETYTKTSTKIDFVMAPSSTSAQIQFAVSPKASYTLTNVTTTTATTDNPYTFAVTSGSYTELEFKIQSEKDSIDAPTSFNTVIVKVYSASKDATLKELELYKADGTTLAKDVDNKLFVYNSTTLNQGTFTAPYKIGDAVVLTGTANDTNAVITGDGNKSLAAGGTIKYKVLVKSQYAILNTSLSTALLNSAELQQEYQLIVERNEASKVCTLDELVVKDTSGNELTLNPIFAGATQNYKIENLADSITKVNISYKATDPNSDVTGDIGDVELTLPAGSTKIVEQELKVTVTAEDTNYSKKYTIRVSRTQVVLSTVNDIDNILVTDSSAKTYATYSSTKYLYEFEIPATEGGVTFNITTKSTAATLVDAADQPISNPLVLTVDEGKTEQVTIICKAEDGTPGTAYVYKVSRKEKDLDATLKSLSYNGIPLADFDPDKINYSINLTHEVETFYLEGVVNKSTSKISSNDAPKDSPAALIDGINGPYQITIVAENPLSTKVYTVTVIRDASNELSALTATDKSNNELIDSVSGEKLLQFEAATTTYSFTVPYEIEKINLNATAVGGNLVTITGAGEITLTEGLNEITIEVTPASKLNKKPYKVNVTRVKGETDNTIKSFQYFKNSEDKNHTDDTTHEPAPIYTSLAINATDTEYSYYVSRDITVFEPVILPNNDKATVIMPDNKVINVGQKNTFEVTVKSQTGSPRKYTFIVYNCDIDNEITSLKLKESSAGAELVDNDSNKLLVFNKETLTYNIEVDYSIKDVYLEALLKSNYATMKYSTTGTSYNDFASQKVELQPGDNKFYFYAISEYGKLVNDGTTGKSKIYLVNITRKAADNDPTLKSLTVTIDGTAYNWNAALDDAQALGTNETYPYVIEDIGNTVTSLNIQAVANKTTTKITGQIGNQPLNDLQVSGTTTGYIFNFTVTSTAEDGSYNTYNITVSRGKLDVEEDNTITGITVVDSLGNSNYLVFNTGTTKYEITIPYSINGTKVTSYTINATKAATSPATINGAGQNAIDTTSGNYEKTHYVYATSQKGVAGTKYEIKVTVNAANAEARLRTLSIGGEPYLPFNPNTFNYIYGTVPNGTKKIDIAATAIDPTAVITGDVGNDLQLDEGANQFTIVVTAESGKYLQYKVTITRDSSIPVLTNLAATSIELLDTNDKATTFDSETTTYHSIVAYKTQNATITASVENANYDVTCSNSIPGTTTGVNRSFTVVLSVGENPIEIKVTNLAGKSKTYTYIISRRDEESSNTSITSLKLLGREDSVEYIGATDFSDLKNSYTITVPNKVKNVDLAVQVEDIADAFGPGATVRYINDDNLRVGENEVIALVTAENGTTRTISIMVNRQPYAFDVEIAEIERFKDDYSANTILAKYNVASNIDQLTVSVNNQDPTNPDNPDFVILNGNTLKIGENDVKIKIICDDGSYKMLEFKVQRAAYDFELSIKEINRFKNDYASDDLQRSYPVDSDIDSLTFEVKDKNENAEYTPTVKILSDEKLNVGTNNVRIQIIGEDGYKSDPIEFVVRRAVYEYEIGIKEIARFKNDYAIDDLQKKYTVPSDVTSLTYTIKDTNENSAAPTYKILSGEKLNVGSNQVILQILGSDGFTPTIVEFTVVREEYEFNISTPEIADLESDYANGTLKTKYTVESNVTSVNFDITYTEEDAETKPEFVVLSGGELKPGDNEVTVQITAADGSVSVETINVYRKPMTFSVLDKNGVDDYTAVEVKKNEIYTIDLGKDGVASQITDYTKFIKDDENAELKVTVLNEESIKNADCNEVLVQVTNSDGTESKVVRFDLKAAKSPATSFDLYVWIVLGVAVLLLIIILICVNRDKYGSVSRKRKTN